MNDELEHWKDKALQLGMVLSTREAELEQERQLNGRLRARVVDLEDACRKGSAACEKQFDGLTLESTSRELLAAVQAGVIACRDVLLANAASSGAMR